MIKKELTLVISAKTEIELNNIVKVLALTLNNDTIRLVVDSNTNIDWDAEVEIATPSMDEYYQAADELYAKLIHNANAFSDWEYKFLTDMYSMSIEKKGYTEKQRGWIRKMKEKHLG